MCLNLIGSKFRSISEVEELLNSNRITEEKIIQIKDNRDEIEYNLDLVRQFEELEELGI